LPRRTGRWCLPSLDARKTLDPRTKPSCMRASGAAFDDDPPNSRADDEAIRPRRRIPSQDAPPFVACQRRGTQGRRASRRAFRKTKVKRPSCIPGVSDAEVRTANTRAALRLPAVYQDTPGLPELRSTPMHSRYVGTRTKRTRRTQTHCTCINRAAS
jgi:hypothetical protein